MNVLFETVAEAFYFTCSAFSFQFFFAIPFNLFENNLANCMMYDALHLQSKSVKLKRWKSNALKKLLLFTKSVYFSVWLARQQIEMQKILKIRLESIVGLRCE